MRILFIQAICTGLVAMAEVAAQPVAAPVEVMVLGTYHFANPGRDINNIKADSVLTPARQQQLASVAAALLRFRPTHVMVEMESEAPGLAVPAYARFTPAMLATEPNEIVQLGYRIAHQAGLATVHGIDEQPKADEPDYFPFEKLQAAAGQFGQNQVLEAANSKVAASARAMEAAQSSRNVSQLLQDVNAAGTIYGNMDSYYQLLAIGDRNNQAGADLNAMWYLRNAKIFGKLMQVAPPGSGARVLVVYGAGHGFWLRHFASLTPGYRNVDVMPFLQAAP